MSYYGNNFTRVVNSDAQTSTLLEGVAGALLNINSSPGYTGFTPIKPADDITLDVNTLNAIAASKTILLDGTALSGANRKLNLGLDTEDNAKSLIKIFGLDVDPNPKLIKTAKIGAANAAFKITLGTTGGTTFTYVSFTTNGATNAVALDIADASATKSGYLSVELGSTANSIVFDVVQKQTA
jgi:hypothetical protein